MDSLTSGGAASRGTTAPHVSVTADIAVSDGGVLFYQRSLHFPPLMDDMARRLLSGELLAMSEDVSTNWRRLRKKVGLGRY